METTCVIQKPQKKKQKLNEEDIDENRKSLGNLPEEILRHILSFLPTTDAVRTSLLSKRWEYLWDSIPNLHFSDRPISRRKRKGKRSTLFMNFVDRVLCLRDSSDIKRFTLRCDELHDASRVHTWISAAIKHNVKELYIGLHNFKGEFSLPCCLFTCKALTSLHLCIPCILKLPSAVCFSKLQILTINKVTFSDEYLTQQFFSGLPVLEKLELNDCCWESLKVVRISAPNLHFLRIHEFVNRNSRYREGCQVMIFGGCLKKFHYSGLLFNEYCLYESIKLEKAVISTRAYNPSQQITYCMYNLLKGLSNVELLRLSYDEVKVLIHGAELLPHLPMFNNLKNLSFNGSSVDLDGEALLNILQRTPCLENLEFFMGISLSSDSEEADRILYPVPSCFSSHLKWIKVNCYGVENMLSAIKILLNKAVVLEEIIISSLKHRGGNIDKRMKACKQLKELPRVSQNCKIVLKWSYYPAGKECEFVL
ncbi:F-box/LRR-repeat protein At4g14103-like [Corylus avellana]|uniref:F-box/LRR-repeat protein At4g14103-like n=1 Tax=Corylus avellana TaxID=13451 RepID=UPI00286C3F77|nr:F-box/LRR-repeat protein At4g14103-like [Corylus avellana]